MKRTTTITLATALVAQPFIFTSTAFAEEPAEGTVSSKDEVVYANLLANGSVEELYIVNALSITEEGIIRDYGAYNQVKNLTSLFDIQQPSEDEVELEATEGMFYYQGNLPGDTPLPWDFEISYSIDGQKIQPEELLGQDGSFQLDIDVTQNPEVDPAFFENYLLQISIPLDGEQFSQIEAPGATIANAGQDKQLAFTVMPEEGGSFEVNAEVKNFEMDGIEISALPSSFAIESPDTEELTGEFDTLTGAISDLNDGLGEVKSGLDELSSGLSQLEDGSSQYKSGLSETANAGSELVAASSSIQSGLLEISEGLNGSDMDMDIGLDEGLFDALNQFAAGMSELAGGVDELKTGYEQAYGALKESIDDIPSHEISEDDIQQLYMDNPESETVQQLVDTYVAAQTAKGTFNAVKEAFDAVGPALEEISSSASQLEEGMNTFTASVQEAFQDLNPGEGLEELSSGIAELASQYGSFHIGLTEYTNGVSQLSTSYSELHSGISESANGSSQLSGGLSEIRGGMTELETATGEIPEQMQKEIDEMISQYDKSDFEAISFTSEENNDVINNVQFVIQTASITSPDDSEDEVEQEEEPGIWQRFLQLFGWN
ncbi:YhgE/Pip domain-containing protein [Alkalicoccobacillus porphyridii]|uniref:YhgE/Pip domain-containing protein n=1 Tax=Alkalicoccobacillus porphyridii TaxID=2597270 RepID=A0A554A133_9BACI|nr:YhgE/Pip domain-containing protein [Alkalicoccobacillus porphyridii]TSB47393.1 YhgE/Pip domain-containing protein [Alkalicoccobacillus porphyridii]